jgi:sterol desaturase/sphingolipid hydroxylase (fatty acid hydroxylase superfamily)
MIFVLGVLDQLRQMLPFLAIGLVLELFVRVQDRFGWDRLGLNAVISVLYLASGVAFGLWAGSALLAFVHRLPGAGVLSFSMGPSPSWLLILIGACGYTVLSDFFGYWLHRLQHRIPWLWALHQLHHNDEHMNVTTGLRLHWLDVPVLWIGELLPIAYLCTPAPSLIFGIWLVNFTIVFFEHLDLPLGFGRWNWLVCTPQTHRIHHSALAVHRDKNFAGIWPGWDVCFGTYYAPKAGEYPPTGLITPGEPPWRVMLLPLKTWAALIRPPRLRFAIHEAMMAPEHPAVVLGDRGPILAPRERADITGQEQPIVRGRDHALFATTGTARRIV